MTTKYAWAALTGETRIPGADGPHHGTVAAARAAGWPSQAYRYALVAFDANGERGLNLEERLMAGLEGPLNARERALCPRE